VKSIEIFPCRGHEHLMQTYREILAQGGEGIILRKPNSFYHEEGSFFSLKVAISNRELKFVLENE
jgi:ATP-dependent DNA ligase